MIGRSFFRVLGLFLDVTCYVFRRANMIHDVSQKRLSRSETFVRTKENEIRQNFNLVSLPILDHVTSYSLSCVFFLISVFFSLRGEKKSFRRNPRKISPKTEQPEKISKKNFQQICKIMKTVFAFRFVNRNRRFFRFSFRFFSFIWFRLFGFVFRNFSFRSFRATFFTECQPLCRK